MSKDADMNNEQGIPIKDAYRMLLSIDKGITYGGLNATELEQMKKVDWNKARKLANSLHSLKWTILLLIAFVLCAIAFWLSEPLKYYALGIGICCAYFLSKREGERAGFMDGYGEGFDDGINKALGLSNEDLADFRQRVNDIELNENLVNKWNNEDEEAFNKIDCGKECLPYIESAKEIEHLLRKQMRFIESEVDTDSEYRQKMDKDLAKTMLNSKETPDRRIKAANNILEMIEAHKANFRKPVKQLNNDLWDKIEEFEKKVDSVKDEVINKKILEWTVLCKKVYAQRVMQLETLLRREEDDSFLPTMVLDHKGDCEWHTSDHFIEMMKWNNKILAEAKHADDRYEGDRVKLGSRLFGIE